MSATTWLRNLRIGRVWTLLRVTPDREIRLEIPDSHSLTLSPLEAVRLAGALREASDQALQKEAQE